VFLDQSEAAAAPTNYVEAFHLNGGQGRNRTADASLFRAALYQLSYLARDKSNSNRRSDFLQFGELRTGLALDVSVQTVAMCVHRDDRRELVHAQVPHRFRNSELEQMHA
jgi:hypothetical protein